MMRHLRVLLSVFEINLEITHDIFSARSVQHVAATGWVDVAPFDFVFLMILNLLFFVVLENICLLSVCWNVWQLNCV